MPTSIDDNLHQQRWRIPYWMGACVFLVVAGFFLWEEHRAHLLGALPYVLLLLCPFVHLFMHRGHNGHGGHHGHSSTRTPGDERRTP
jgi:uncharacterized membrane protein YkvI